MPPPQDITRLIFLWQKGDKTAENVLFEALYHKLRSIAGHCLKTEPRNQSLGPTALVHEAYLRFQHAENIDVTGRAHFLSLAAQVMRRILVDRARARMAGKRGGDHVMAELPDEFALSQADADEILAVNLALEVLSRHSPRQVQLVELRYFAGFSEDESAAALGVSSRTARRDWQIARSRLREAIDGTRTAN